MGSYEERKAKHEKAVRTHLLQISVALWILVGIETVSVLIK